MLSVLFVDDDAASGGDGGAWETAFEDLQLALDAASVRNTDALADNDVDQIWIAEGTYTPSALLQSGAARSASFSMVDGVGLYGGFQGTETELSERDWAVHQTILSGNLGDLDSKKDNARTVAYVEEGVHATVDGITISGGYADYYSDEHHEFHHGGGIYSKGELNVLNSVFTNNTASDHGGGLYSRGTLTVMNSRFIQNVASWGAGLSNHGTGSVSNSEFLNGSVDSDGGGLFNRGILVVSASRFSDNSADRGGAVDNNGTITVDDCDFEANYAQYEGGGIHNGNTMDLYNSAFSNNRADDKGGAVYSSGYATIAGTIVSGNTSDRGGGIYNKWGRLTCVNSTIAGNWADSNGGGIYIGEDTTEDATICNTIVAWNRSPGANDLRCSISTVSGANNIISDGTGQGIFSDGTDGNLVGTAESPIDPGLSDWTRLPGGGWGYYLLPGSVAENAGSNLQSIGTVDFHGNPRVQDEVVDIGAVEGISTPSTGVVYAVTSADDTIAQDGILTFWEAYYAATRNEAVGDAPAGSFGERDTIRFAQSFPGTIELDGTAIELFGTLTIDKGPGSSATFDAGGKSRVFIVERCDTDIVLDGVTVTGGVHHYTGGGVYNRGLLTVTNSIFSLNEASYGGGISNYGRLVLRNSTLTDNSATYGGGLHSMTDSAVTAIYNTVVAGNVAMVTHDIKYGGGTLSGTHNLIGVNSGQGVFVDGEDGNLVGTADSPLDPGLSDWTKLPSGGWGYYLLPGAVVEDAGDNAQAVESTDFHRNPRIQNGTVDIGAVEGTSIPDPAVTYVVTSFDKTVAEDGILTFWEAFQAAARNETVGDAPGGSFGERDVIEFAESAPDELLLDGEPLELSGTLEIRAQEGKRVLFNAEDASRVFEIQRRTSDIVLNGLVISGGYSEENGGAIFNRGTLNIVNSMVSANSAKYGGGIYNWGTLTVTGSTISDNYSTVHGAGIYSNASTVAISDSTLSRNVAGYEGGGLFSYWGTFTIDASTFEGNAAADNGGGIQSDRGVFEIADCLFLDNRSTRYGGGLSTESALGHSLSTIVGSVFSNNSAHMGGGIYNNQTPLAVANSTLVRNNATIYGGGITVDGGDCEMAVNNCLIALNSGYRYKEIDDQDAALSGSNNLIGDGDEQQSFVHGENGNIVGTTEAPIDPRLSDWTQRDDGTWGYLLLAGSPALNAGDNALAVDASGQPLTHDYFGNDRIQDGIVDIGAAEGASPEIAGQTYVVTSLEPVIDASDGRLTFLEAFEAASRNCPVGDAPRGSYNARDVIQMEAGVEGTVLLEGSELKIAGDLTILGSDASSVVFDAQGQSRVFYVQSEVSLCLDGVTVTGGASEGEGGGILSHGALTLRNTVFEGNRSAGHGGAVRSMEQLRAENSTFSHNYSEGRGGAINGGGENLLENCIISFNQSDDYAGAVSLSGTSKIVNSTIEGNLGASRGGAISSYGDMTITNCFILGNSLKGLGGAIDASDYASLRIDNSVICGNYSTSWGGAIFVDSGCQPIITNSIIAGNASGERGGGIEVRGGLFLYNTIVAENTAPSAPDVYGKFISIEGNNNLIGNGSTVHFATAASNLVGVDPRFVRNPSDGGDGWGDDTRTEDVDESLNDDFGDLRLRAGSPAIDAGSNASLPVDWADLDADGDQTEPIPFDLAGNDRVVGESVDIGAYEHIPITLLPGDLNADGLVGSADLDVVRANWGSTVSAGSIYDGDPSGDGVVNGSDLDIVRANWGSTIPQSASLSPRTAPVKAEREQQEIATVAREPSRLSSELAWADAIDALARRREARKEKVVDLALLELTANR